MHKIMMRIPMAVLALLLAGCGRSDDSPEEIAKPGVIPKAVGIEIEKERERFRNLPGRTGILAEDSIYSVFAEELIIRDFFQDRRRGFFLDVGCAWPTVGNNTYYLEKHLDWTGIGIDALGDFAAGWARARPRSKFFNFLVTDETGGLGTFFKSEGLGLSSTSREHAAGETFGVYVEPEEIEVPMITLTDLLDREGVTKIDLVSMDIEGHELKALAGFDIERFQPELLVIEGHDPEVKKFLSERGYRQIQRYIHFDIFNRYFRPRKHR